MPINEELIQEIRSSASITQVIGHYLPLIKKGRGYTALCPFHDDHDPSLSISEEKQIYKCFVCGKGGNVFTFVRDYKHCSFEEAVAEVAEIIGRPISLPKRSNPGNDKNRKAYALMDDAMTFANYLLTSKGAQKARDYLNERQLDQKIIERFMIGYDPNGDVLYQYLKNKGYTDEELLRFNLVRINEYGSSDVFHDRILFPIHDQYGRCVAFSARTIINDQVKYINTSQTGIYTKGDILYNMHRVKDAVKAANRVIVCEGVMDVIAFARAEVDYVVATLGTACSQKQLELLKRLSKNLVLAYDGDDAGQNAILKLGEMALKNGFNVAVMPNDTGLDPDEIVNKYKGKALRDLLGKAVHFIDFAMTYYAKRYNLNNYSERKAMNQKVDALIQCLSDEYDRVNFSKALFDLTKMQKIASEDRKKWYNNKQVFQKSYSIDGLSKAEYIILAEMALSPKAIALYQHELGCMLQDSDEALAFLIIEDYRKYGNCELSRIYDKTEDQAVKQLITDLSTWDFIPDTYSEDLMKSAIAKVQREMQMRKLEKLQKEIKKIATLDPIQARAYLDEYTRIAKALGGNYGKENKRK